MARLHVFADEAGDFDFTNGERTSRYFIICTCSMESCRVGEDLLRLRRTLAWEGCELGDYLHASTEKQEVRNRIFGVIVNCGISVQATIMEKRKADPAIRESLVRFYTYGWRNHFFNGMQEIITPYPELHVTAASIGIKKERTIFKKAVASIMSQTIVGKVWAADVFPSGTDPCLQVADYCAWAIQRKWERGDARSYDLVKKLITYESDIWADNSQYFD